METTHIGSIVVPAWDWDPKHKPQKKTTTMEPIDARAPGARIAIFFFCRTWAEGSMAKLALLSKAPRSPKLRRRKTAWVSASLFVWFGFGG